MSRPRSSVSSGREIDTKGTHGGVVVDASSGKPVKGVPVLVQRQVEGKTSGEIKLVSDAEGRFKFDLPADWAFLE
jgi:5-hydroxyisourate hydrolase-like protein (transthyretin family)